jgi:hypothetical protein
MVIANPLQVHAVAHATITSDKDRCLVARQVACQLPAGHDFAIALSSEGQSPERAACQPEPPVPGKFVPHAKAGLDSRLNGLMMTVG